MVLFQLIYYHKILYLQLRTFKQQKKEGYAGGYLFCPKAGLYKYMFDEDLTSLYPSIIMSINIGKETLVARIIDEDDRNNRLVLTI